MELDGDPRIITVMERSTLLSGTGVVGASRTSRQRAGSPSDASRDRPWARSSDATVPPRRRYRSDPRSRRARSRTPSPGRPTSLPIAPSDLVGAPTGTGRGCSHDGVPPVHAVPEPSLRRRTGSCDGDVTSARRRSRLNRNRATASSRSTIAVGTGSPMYPLAAMRAPSWQVGPVGSTSGAPRRF
jgi:hypothetical protein